MKRESFQVIFTLQNLTSRVVDTVSNAIACASFSALLMYREL